MVIDGALIPIVAILAFAGTAIGVPLARAHARRIDRGPNDQMPLELKTRLERMEQALDSIAIEVERISEAQRFTTKLLAEKPKEQSLPPRAP
jgi:hypothetical protein